jgi:hypothetical protein
MVTVSESILNFPDYAITLTSYLKAETGLKVVNPDAIFRLGQMMAARYPDVLANMHKNLPQITEQPEAADRRCKLTAVLVKDIRNAHDAGESIRSLAIHYELSVSTVWKIVKGRIWKTLS